MNSNESRIVYSAEMDKFLSYKYTREVGTRFYWVSSVNVTLGAGWLLYIGTCCRTVGDDNVFNESLSSYVMWAINKTDRTMFDNCHWVKVAINDNYNMHSITLGNVSNQISSMDFTTTFPVEL